VQGKIGPARVDDTAQGCGVVSSRLRAGP
jgi:hypothetical protein